MEYTDRDLLARVKNLPLIADQGLPSSHLGITQLKGRKIKKALRVGKLNPRETVSPAEQFIYVFASLYRSRVPGGQK